MIKVILRKTKRLLRTDRKIQMKIGGIILLVLIMVAQGNIIKGQAKVLAKVTAEKAIVDNIPEMEKEIAFEDIKSLAPEQQLAAIERILEGTGYRNQVYHAIINGDVYSTNDVIGDYTITKITMEAITLENKERKEEKNLYFPDNGLAELMKQ